MIPHAWLFVSAALAAGQAPPQTLDPAEVVDLTWAPLTVESPEVHRRSATLFAETARTLDVSVADTRFAITVYATHEDKALATGSGDGAGVGDDGRGHLVLDDERVTKQDGRLEAELLLRRTWGPPASARWARATAVALSAGGARDEALRISAWVAQADEATPLDVLCNPQRPQRSPLLEDALAALAVDELCKQHGLEAARECWSRGTFDASLLANHWPARLAAEVEAHRDTFADHRHKRSAVQDDANLRGVSFAHEGYQIVDGYLSRQAQRSLQQVQELGANAVTIMPFGYYRSTHDLRVRWSGRGRNAGSETDTALFVSGARARGLGLRTMLKPHLWGHGGWCGHLCMRSESDWDAWFASYGEFLVHYALLAELGGFTWLSIGCELAETTKAHPERWADLASRARRLFAGGLTYSANWGEEAESLSFASSLDAVGVDFYYPLSDDDAPTDEQLADGARRQLARMEALSRQLGKPIVLTEVGFPAREQAWRDPHRPGHQDPSSVDAQARCYRALATALDERDRDSVPGWFLWKWPTYDTWSEKTDYWPASEAARDSLAVMLGDSP